MTGAFYVGTVNGPTSITRLESFENVSKNCQFQFLDPPTSYTKKKIGQFTISVQSENSLL